MTSSDLALAKERFLEALELPAAEHGAFLARLEREDAALARAVRGLLLAHGGAAADGLERRAEAFEFAASARRAPGQRLGDHELIEEIGAGAHGVVWRARHVALGRIVALKVLRGGTLAGARELERLRAEAEAVARLDHPGIVPVHEVGEHEGFAFFSMRWIEGGTLADRLGERWPAPRAAQLVAEVARAVHHAHQRGLLHRDLKPSNVLLDAEGRPHVADFGIAKRLDGGGSATTTRALAGTPAYMAPEQADGGELTVATDVWSLGCILHELLTGRPAFAGDSVTEVLRRIRQEEPASLRELRPDVPRDLETIALACLRKDPARRYPSADALADDLERWLAHEPIAARRTNALEHAVLFCRRSPLAASLIGIVSGLVVLLAIVATWASFELGARLRDSYLGEARATRLSQATGARSAALELLTRAASIRRGDDLRDEAIASLALTDLALEQRVPRPPGIEAAVVPDPDLSRLALCDAGGLRVLAFDGSERARLSDAADVTFVRWSPRGRWLLSRHDSPAVGARARVWDLASGAEAWTSGDTVTHRAADFSPDEHRLAYATLEDELVVVEIPGGAPLLRAEVPGRVRSVRFRPDGARVALAVASEPPTLEVRDPSDGTVAWAFPLPSEPYDVVWTGDGRGVAVACADFRILVLDEGANAPRVVCQGHSAEVVELHACPGTSLVASYSWDETARLWDTSTGRELRRASARGLGFGADGRRFGLTDAHSWSLWRVEHGDHLRHLQAHTGKSPLTIAFAPDGRALATGGPDGVYHWDGSAGSRPVPVHALDTRAVVFDRAGRALYSSGKDGLFRTELAAGSAPEALIQGAFWQLALARDGTLAVQGSGVVLLLDPERPAEARALPGGDGMEYLTMAADGSRVATGSWRGHGVRVWTPREGDEPRVFLPEQINVAAALSPDGELLATATSERVEVWRVDTGERLHAHERRRAVGNAPAPLVFSPDGAALAFALSNEIVRILDTTTFEVLATLEPPNLEALFDLEYTPDGAILGTACSTNRMQLWDLAAIDARLAELGLR